MNARNTGDNVGSKIPHKMKKSLINAVNEAAYVSISDFVRDAIKEKLVHEGFLKIIPENQSDKVVNDETKSAQQ